MRTAKPEPSNLAPEKLLEKLAQRVRTLRERKALTQEDFASRCGISVSFVSLLERGRRSPSYETLVSVAEALDIPVADLFQDLSGTDEEHAYFNLLSDFARGAGLSLVQVEKVIEMAQLMFDITPERRSIPVTARHELCTVERCGRRVLARGLCASHYHQQRRARARGR